MATWHQMRARAPLYHETKWTVVDDPPNAMTTLMGFETEEGANAFVERAKARGSGRHMYVLPPGGIRVNKA
jgi:hypothetical protein